MKYAEYKTRLMKLSGITDEKELDKALRGRSKYDPKTLKPLPYPGISVIHNIEAGVAEELRLPQSAKRFKEELQDADLGDNVAFVSLESFHATTFDLINEPRHEKILAEAGKVYSNVRLAVIGATMEFLLESGIELRAKVVIEGIGMFAPQSVILKLKFSELAARVFQEYRRALNEHLIDRVDGYSVIRGKDWDEKLAGHITFGYVVNSMSEPEIDTFLDKMSKFDEEFQKQEIEFDLTQGEVTIFTDMDRYYPIKAGIWLPSA